jgi:hypothetical protein
MKLALSIIALVCLLAVAIIAGLVRHGHIDTAGQGVLLLDETQSAECRDGGGCAAFSERELRVLFGMGVQRGMLECKGRRL